MIDKYAFQKALLLRHRAVQHCLGRGLVLTGLRFGPLILVGAILATTLMRRGPASSRRCRGRGRWLVRWLLLLGGHSGKTLRNSSSGKKLVSLPSPDRAAESWTHPFLGLFFRYSHSAPPPLTLSPSTSAPESHCPPAEPPALSLAWVHPQVDHES